MSPPRCADLARLGGVSRARITQIMNLLNLPPWKQEKILLLEGRTGVTEREVRGSCLVWPRSDRRKCEDKFYFWMEPLTASASKGGK